MRGVFFMSVQPLDQLVPALRLAAQESAALCHWARPAFTDHKPGTAAGAGVLNFLFSRDPRYVNDGCCGPRSRSAAKAAMGIKTRRLPPDLALIGGPEAAAGADPATAAMAVEPEEGGGLSLWSTLVEIQTVMSIPSFLIIIVQVRCRPDFASTASLMAPGLSGSTAPCKLRAPRTGYYAVVMLPRSAVSCYNGG